MLKWLVYLALLANLAGFFWHYQPGLFQKLTTSAVPVLAADTPQLVLLEEYESAQNKTSISAQEGQRCYSLGPFGKRAEAKNVAKELADLGVTAMLRVDKEKTTAGYWVLIPPLENKALARQTIAQLKEKSIRDYFLVATGSQKNAISLGVFSRSDLAARRLRDIEKLGFRARVEKVELPDRQYWVEWSMQADITVTVDQLQNWYKQYSGIGQTERACPTNQQ